MGSEAWRGCDINPLIWAEIDGSFTQKFFVMAQIPAHTSRSEVKNGWLREVFPSNHSFPERGDVFSISDFHDEREYIL
ncbi:MAG: hypothetical protein WBA39_24315 [Rivularia sp. (in: cyanobacteria)]